MREDLWTGRLLFPLPGHNGEQVRHALAASKGKPSRSKAEAKREAKELRFKGIDTICKEAVPSMEKPVNVMTYDMRDFVVSCVDRYCDLAKVSRQSLANVPAPFSESRVTKPVKGEEPMGRLQPALVPRDEVRPCMLVLVSSVGNIEGVSARKRRRGFPRKLNRTVVDCFARVVAHGLRNLSYSVAIVLKDPTASGGGGAILKWGLDREHKSGGFLKTPYCRRNPQQ